MIRHLCQRRTLLLFALLLSGIGYLATQPTHRMPWLSQCSGPAPAWLPALIEQAKAVQLPGFQLALRSKDGLQLHCVAGWAGGNVFEGRLRDDHRMRYASLSKIFTSLLSMRLIDEGLLHTEDQLLEWLTLAGPLSDPRIAEIRIGQLLNHTAGFDRALTPDPMLSPHPWCPHDLPHLQRIKLDHRPGSHYAYSNVGYCLLGEVIERLTQQSLADNFNRYLFAPAGVKNIQPLTRGEISNNEAGHLFDAAESQEGLLSFDYQALIASGAWTGTASDLLHVLEYALDTQNSDLLSCAARKQLLMTLPTCDIRRWRHCHSFGFYQYREAGKQSMYWRDGSLPGVSSFAALFDDDTKIVFLSHGRHHQWMIGNDRIGRFLYEQLAEE